MIVQRTSRLERLCRRHDLLLIIYNLVMYALVIIVPLFTFAALVWFVEWWSGPDTPPRECIITDRGNIVCGERAL